MNPSEFRAKSGGGVSSMRAGIPPEQGLTPPSDWGLPRAEKVSLPPDWGLPRGQGAKTSPWGRSCASSIRSHISQFGSCASLIRLRASWARKQTGESAQTGSKPEGHCWSSPLSLPHCAFGVLSAGSGSQCQQQLCTCDQKLAYCLKRNLRSYNTFYLRFPKSLC